MPSPLRQFAKRVRRRAFEVVGDDRYSRPACFDMESRLLKHLDFMGGVFVEAGANDGFTQSNTYWLECFRGWRGVLVEPVPEKAAECRRNRPRALTVNAALVARDDHGRIMVTAAGLRGYVTGSFADPEWERHHRAVAAQQERLEPRDIIVPTRTLASVIAESGFGRIDLLSLDVEGYEIEVLRGMGQYRPGHILIELGDLPKIMAALDGQYALVEHITQNDALLKRI